MPSNTTIQRPIGAPESFSSVIDWGWKYGPGLIQSAQNDFQAADLERRAVKTIPVSGPSSPVVTEIVIALRTLLNLRHVEAGPGTIVLEDTAANIALAESLVASDSARITDMIKHHLHQARIARRYRLAETRTRRRGRRCLDFTSFVVAQVDVSVGFSLRPAPPAIRDPQGHDHSGVVCFCGGRGNAPIIRVAIRLPSPMAPRITRNTNRAAVTSVVSSATRKKRSPIPMQ